jgi:diguanylate cyclase (GGDEF)-like protein
MVARQGGEEFVILLPEAQIEQAAAMAEDFRERISLLDCTRWQGIERMTASIGVTVSPALGENPDDLLRRADSALYAAKRAGRNCVRVVAHSPVAVPPVQESFAEFTTPEARAARRR